MGDSNAKTCMYVRLPRQWWIFDWFSRRERSSQRPQKGQHQFLFCISFPNDADFHASAEFVRLLSKTIIIMMRNKKTFSKQLKSLPPPKMFSQASKVFKVAMRSAACRCPIILKYCTQPDSRFFVHHHNTAQGNCVKFHYWHCTVCLLQLCMPWQYINLSAPFKNIYFRWSRNVGLGYGYHYSRIDF